MAKLTLTNLSSLQNEQSAISIINNNNDAIEAAVEKTLSRDGTVPNQMTQELDMNSQRILNLVQPVTDNEPVRLADLNAIFVPNPSGGNVIGPASSVGGNLPVFSGSTGKILADSGINPSSKANVASPTFTGTVTTPNLIVTGNASVGGNETITGTLGVTGVATFSATPVVPAASFANASLANMAGDTVKGRLSTTGAPQDLTKTQLTTLVNPVTSSLSGAAPASGGGTTNYLRADATWADPRIKVLLNTYTASASASLQDTACFTTTYTSYELEIINLIPSTANVNIQLQVYSGSFQTSSYNSSYSYFTGAGVGNGTTSTYIPLNVPGLIANSISGLFGTIRVWNPAVSSSSPKMWLGQFSQQGNSTSGMNVHTTAGDWYNGASITGFRVIPSSGNLTSGIIKLYGYV